jgi:hypothetical protein
VLELDRPSRTLGRAKPTTTARCCRDLSCSADPADPEDVGVDADSPKRTNPDTGETPGALERIDDGHDAAHF